MHIVLLYIDGRHILWSFVQFLDFLKFLYSGNFFRFVGNYCCHSAMGFYFHFANKCWMSLYLLFSKLLSKQAHGMPFFVAGYWIVLHISDYHLHIYWAIWLYLFQLLLYHMLLSVLWFYIHKRICGAKIYVGSKQKCGRCFESVALMIRCLVGSGSLPEGHQVFLN